MKRKSLWLLLLVLPLIPIFLGLGDFIYPRFSDYSDLTISHLPNAVYIQNAIRDFGAIPLWSDQLMGGYPFGADPLSGIWYPPGWLAILAPAPLGYNLAIALHLLWGGLGMTAFLRRSGMKWAATIFAGIAFMAMPKLFSHFVLGHISLVYSIAWIPWLLLAETIRSRSGRNNWKASQLPGCVLGIIALADVRGLAYAGLLYFFFWLWNSLRRPTDAQPKPNFLISAGLFAASAVIAAGIAAAQLLPLIQFTSLSTRADLTASDVMAFSLPIKKLLNLFIPEFGGYAEWIVYPGAIVVFLIILVLATPGLRKRLVFWLAVIAGALLLSLGSNLPGFEWLGNLPGASLLRIPPRLMFIGGIAMIIVAAQAFDELISGYVKPKFDPIFWMVAITGFFIMLILGSLVMKIEVGLNIVWGTLGLAIGTLLIGLAERRLIVEKAVAIIIPSLLLADLLGVNFQSIQYKKADVVLQDGKAAVKFLEQDQSDFRVYSPSYAIPQLAAAQAGIEMVSAINPLALASYSEWMLTASGARSQGYSVAAPPLDETSVWQSNIDKKINAGLLGLLNVKYVASTYPISHPDLAQVWQADGTWIYKNKLYKPRAWIETGNSGSVASNSEVKFLVEQPGKISLEVVGPGNLVLSEVNYPGWQAWIDHVKAPILRIANIIMGISLPAGKHTVEFVYIPTLQYAGIGISILVWLAAIILNLKRRTK